MRDIVADYIKSHDLAGKKILVGYSTGKDSSALLHICSELNLKPVAMHLNHGWRVQESDLEEVLAKNFCKKLGVELYTERLGPDVEKSETSAREARYAFFERGVKKYGADAVFLAHNKNDNIETLLYRISKGAGVHGLCSIPQVRGVFHRPLLDVTREQIENYIKECAIETAEDSSNSDVKYARNFIRKEILPKFLELNPDAINAMGNLIKIMNSQSEIIKDVASSVLKDDKILTQKFLELTNAQQMGVLHEFLKNDLKNCSYRKISELLEFVLKNSTFPSHHKCSLNSELFFLVNKHTLVKSQSRVELPQETL